MITQWFRRIWFLGKFISGSNTLSLLLEHFESPKQQQFIFVWCVLWCVHYGVPRQLLHFETERKNILSLLLLCLFYCRVAHQWIWYEKGRAVIYMNIYVFTYKIVRYSESTILYPCVSQSLFQSIHFFSNMQNRVVIIILIIPNTDDFVDQKKIIKFIMTW